MNHPKALSTRCSGTVKEPSRLQRRRHQSKWLLVPTMKFVWQVVTTTSQYLHHQREKKYSRPKTTAEPFSKQFTTSRRVELSTVQERDGLIMVLHCHFDQHGIVLLTEVLNLFILGVNIPAIWKTYVIIAILNTETLLLSYLYTFIDSEDIGPAAPPDHREVP